ncbi:imelysin family protein [Tateyamaria omphalii]|uniref:Imelysin peptidase n=1 Tax=Tateyamaria omphalii TaxID=299262 RepID=A0A1P8N1G4_9RHOB|nr:imelysin family protein [Tateyamaria omphalii]APX14088.1 imelysin peptidase [Tateyamaria omphalii]
MRLALAALCLAALPAVADVQRTIDTHILPGHATLAEETAKLAEAAQTDCTPASLRPAFHTAYDAWISISHIQFGPIEDQALHLAMSFWPDPKDSTGKALARLTTATDPIVNDAQSFADVSVAAQGFTALERMLYDPQPDAAYACQLTQAIATGLARKAGSIQVDWPAFATLMIMAGEDGNTRFQTPVEAQRALYTSLSTGLEFLHDQRLGRPLGTFDRPRPRRAEARRSDRSLRHIQLQLAALETLATTMTDTDLTATKAAFATARTRADALDDPALQGVADPAQRLKVEVLQQAVRAIQVAVIDDIGTRLGITAGFNSLDGD